MRWWHVAAMIVSVQYFAAWVIGSSVGFVYPMPFWGIATIGLCFLVIFVGIFCAAQMVVFYRRSEDDLLPALTAELSRVADFPLLFFLVCAQMAVLGWLKAMMPHAVGFWADPMLADLDAFIFGTDPWRLMHPAPAWLSFLMDQAYMTWAFATLTMICALGLAGKGEGRERALIAYFLLIGIGSISQYILPSAGPVFYEAVGHGTRFSEFPINPWVRRISDFLWEAYTTKARVGSGISAMPSIHVAGAAWLALCIGSFAPQIRLLGWAYFTLILLGSVYLGWHYAVDGIAGLAIALFAWSAARWACSARALSIPDIRSPTSQPL